MLPNLPFHFSYLSLMAALLLHFEEFGQLPPQPLQQSVHLAAQGTEKDACYQIAWQIKPKIYTQKKEYTAIKFFPQPK